jgi:hypothetical protein
VHLNLGKNDKVAAEICHLGGIQPILKCIQSSDSEIRRNGCAALNILSCSALGLEQVRSLNGIAPVVACVRDTNTRARRDAMGVLARLCENESEHNQVVQAGGLRAIDIAFSTSDVETQKSALRCIKSLAFHSQVHKTIQEAYPGIPSAIAKLEKGSSDPEVATAAKDVRATLDMISNSK